MPSSSVIPYQGEGVEEVVVEMERDEEDERENSLLTTAVALPVRVMVVMHDFVDLASANGGGTNSSIQHHPEEDEESQVLLPYDWKKDRIRINQFLFFYGYHYGVPLLGELYVLIFMSYDSKLRETLSQYADTDTIGGLMTGKDMLITDVVVLTVLFLNAYLRVSETIGCVTHEYMKPVCGKSYCMYLCFFELAMNLLSYIFMAAFLFPYKTLSRHRAMPFGLFVFLIVFRICSIPLMFPSMLIFSCLTGWV